MTGAQGAAVRQLGLGDSGLSRVSRAVAWIRDHYADPIRVDGLARLSRMIQPRIPPPVRCAARKGRAPPTRDRVSSSKRRRIACVT
nr:hypothetical protein [Actinomadura rayongensis]